MQNIENKGLILRLCARSSSFKDLCAKSRKHWSYVFGGIPFWEPSQAFAGDRETGPSPLLGLSKINHYLEDNLYRIRLSDYEAAVNDKTCCGSWRFVVTDRYAGGVSYINVIWWSGMCFLASDPSAQNAEGWGTLLLC